MIRLPSIQGETPEEKLEEVISYLRELAKAIQDIQLANDERGNT